MGKKRKTTAPPPDPTPARGRPATGQTPQRMFRCTDKQWEAYRAAAAVDQMQLSAWIRSILDTAAAAALKGGRR